jgi:hypothetical protein
VAFDIDGWGAQVRAAELAADAAELHRLYELGKAEIGPRVDHLWSELLSGFDATAVTG